MTEDQHTFFPYQWAFWKAYFIHMRPYLLFISGVAGLAGMSIVQSFDIRQPLSLIAFLSFFLAYGFGQALTDTFQTDTDKISASYRPLSQGIVTPFHVGVVSVIGLVLCSLVLIYLNTWNILFGLLSIFGLATYSYIKKNFWFGGPFHNAWIVALLPIMGFLSMSKEDSILINNSLLYVIFLNFFAYTNFVLIGYLKDISADRQTGYKTFPVKFGWNASVWVADIFLVLSVVLGLFLVKDNTLGLAIFLLGTAVAIIGQLFAHFTKDKREQNAAFPIAVTVRSFILWNLAIILSFHSDLVFFAVGFYILFEIVLFVRPTKSQI